MSAAALDAAYRATTYRVHAEDGDIDIRVDRRQPRLDCWLAGHAAERWAYLSAANPGSRRLSDDENRRRHGELLTRLVAEQRCHIGGESHADAGDWPVEAGVLVAGLGEAEALVLAAAFGQNAIVVGVRGQPARLVWVPERGGAVAD